MGVWRAATAGEESGFGGDQATHKAKDTAKDRYVGRLIGVPYAESFKARSPMLVATPAVFVKARFG